MGSLLSTVAKGWFGVSLVISLLGAYLSARAVHIVGKLLTLGNVSTVTLNNLSVQAVGLWFKVLFLLCPWMRAVNVSEPDNSNKCWDALFAEGEKPPFLLLNHASQLDGFLFVNCTPVKYIKSMRTLAKSGLFKVPVFGQMMKDIGHFPVYFKSSEAGVFKVDREAQSKVMKGVEAHLQAKGCISLYPEGQINRKDSRKLQSFRRGSLKMCREHNMKMWGFVATDCDTAWPNDGGLGGLPATMYYRLFPIEEPEEEDLAAFCANVEAQMQAQLDQVYDIRDQAMGIAKKND